MHAIVYNLEEERQIQTPQGAKILTKGILLGYTDFPEDPVWQNRSDLAFVEVQDMSMNPFEYKWNGQSWEEVND